MDVIEFNEIELTSKITFCEECFNLGHCSKFNELCVLDVCPNFIEGEKTKYATYY